MLDSLPSISLDELSALEPQDTLILTVNNRLARRVLADLSSRLGAERRVMAVPDVVPLSAWLRQLSDQLSFVPHSELASHPIDAFGARMLWQTVIERAEAERALLDTAQAATLAMEADRLLDDWRIEVAPEQETADYQRFCEWRALYHESLEEFDLEDANQAYEAVCRAVHSGDVQDMARHIVLVGFAELSPRLSLMLQAVQRQGSVLSVLQAPTTSAHNVCRVVSQDPDSEWRMAASWVADQLRRNPAGRYAIVSARLEADVALAHRCLRSALGRDELGRAVPYNVAVARPLSGWPLARAALTWLRAMAVASRGWPCAPSDLGPALLAGGCAGNVDEAAGRGLIDAHWRERAVLNVDRADFLSLLERHAPQLFLAWQSCEAGLKGGSASATLDVWTDRFRHQLERLGFPGQRMLDSHSFQVLEALDLALNRLAGQSVVAGKLSFGSAVGLLRRMLDETPFQPQRDASARVDVLGFLEAEGGRWDALWVLGLTDEVMPAVPRPNPFVPLPAMRQANAPRATPERELQWAKGMFGALLDCAPSVWLSHASHEGERELRPSPFIAAFAIEPATDLTQAEPTPCRLERVRDDRGPALQPGKPTRGGIAVVDTQARNPLWAFARYRLGVRRLPAYADVMDQNARGIFLHRAMELVWKMLPDQPALAKQHESGTLDEFISDIVEQAAADCLTDYGQALRRLESTRARSVLRTWLQAEQTRTPFIVRDVEQDYQWTFGPLELRLRLDRIDELDDGRLAVIDYKTGGGNLDPKSDWMRDRPIGLQLPFYASVLAQESSTVAALMLARLHAKGPEIKGLADADCGLPGLVSQRQWPAFADLTWDELMAQWRQTIQQLAQEYIEGHAINRNLRADDIAYCDILPFLRLNEDYRRVE